MWETELIPNFKIVVDYETTEARGKLIPNIISVSHKKHDITHIIKREVLDSIRSTIFKQLNGIS